jgi:hypothetical protein
LNALERTSCCKGVNGKSVEASLQPRASEPAFL